jgi:hypothetical protein
MKLLFWCKNILSKILLSNNRKNIMFNFLVYDIVVSPPKDKDVVSRRLIIEVNGIKTYDEMYPAKTINFGEFNFIHLDNVSIYASDIDDAGNESEKTTLQFTAIDTIGPSKPESIKVNLIRETYNS